MEKSECNIVWFKRDLRLQDHLPLHAAMQDDIPTILLFCFEPSLVRAEESSERHWRFVWQSLNDMQTQLNLHGCTLYVVFEEVITVLETLLQHVQIRRIFSTQEVGLWCTFERDKRLKSFCQKRLIGWEEFPQDGVIRGLKHRAGWQADMEKWLYSTPIHNDLKLLRPIPLPNTIIRSIGKPLPKAWKTPQPHFQPGGEQFAQRYLHSFLEGRAAHYNRHLSKPLASRKSCSRLSPYLAWGNISARQVIHAIEQSSFKEKFQSSFRSFQERMWWRGHYLQKFESDCGMEFHPINRALNNIGRTFDAAKFHAWASGTTGFPMVDASMRCLQATGYLNFRMRAMLATFATFTLWLPWKPVASHLARLFLDFEPGIHFPQLQMQAGLTAYHPLRIYNPSIQAKQHDPEGTFIHQWVPELRTIPAPLVHEPWKLTLLEQALYHCQIGTDYPSPIVDFEKASRFAKDTYWEKRNRPEVLNALPSIWDKLCIPENRALYLKQIGKIDSLTKL